MLRTASSAGHARGPWWVAGAAAVLGLSWLVGSSGVLPIAVLLAIVAGLSSLTSP
jgi:hypothetical protein